MRLLQSPTSASCLRHVGCHFFLNLNAHGWVRGWGQQVEHKNYLLGILY